ncbi:carboxyl transferase domain-containing protein [Nocardia sp. NPDC051787]|uniref:carboxyl transferase domain-containing protein n=1 Tax=Nocardia sp. NPDC051787 TaxID=3155415 RepID=UPI00341A5F3C
MDLVPADSSQAYDMRAVIEEIVDDGEVFEVHAQWARNILCVFARLGGEVVGMHLPLRKHGNPPA